MSILRDILAAKAVEVAEAKARRPLAEVERRAAERLGRDAPRSFRGALERGPDQPVRAIAEIKRASPSAGPIRPGADPAAIARDYEQAGAAAISVLTDRRFFDGDLGFLTRVRQAVSVPLLRKDFLIDVYQVAEAAAAGADAVLVIAAAFDPGDPRLDELLAAARRFGLDALVEVHTRDEAERALAAGAEVLGVNHRDLATFTIDMRLTADIRAWLGKRAGEVVLVGESGIRSPADVAALGRAGAHAVLVGEHLMRAPSPGQALAELLAPGAHASPGGEP